MLLCHFEVPNKAAGCKDYSSTPDLVGCAIPIFGSDPGNFIGSRTLVQNKFRSPKFKFIIVFRISQLGCFKCSGEYYRFEEVKAIIRFISSVNPVFVAVVGNYLILLIRQSTGTGKMEIIRTICQPCYRFTGSIY